MQSCKDAETHTAALSVKNLVLGYGKIRKRPYSDKSMKIVVHGVSFDVEYGKLTCLLGPNGCGKTTTLKAIMGLIEPVSGDVWLDGRNLNDMAERERARKFAYIPQVHRPPFPFSVADIVIMGRTPYLSILTRPTDTDKQIAYAALSLLGLEELADVPYTELSGGQQQLVLIARAITQESDLLIMDEPTAALDFGNQQMVLDCMRDLCSLGKTILMVTHDPNQVLSIADNIVAMDNGRIIAEGLARECVTSDLIQALYDTRAEILEVPLTDSLSERVCIPYPASSGA